MASSSLHGGSGLEGVITRSSVADSSLPFLNLPSWPFPVRHSAHSQCVPAVQMICKSNHGSFAPELARPSSCSHSTERTFIQSLTNSVGIKPSTQPYEKFHKHGSHFRPGAWSRDMGFVSAAVAEFEIYGTLRLNERGLGSPLGTASPSLALR